MPPVLRILYVDDESGLLELGKRALEESGDLLITTAESATKALSLLDSEPFDAVVSDYQMPGMDGIQFLIEVRMKFGSIPFILFTGKGREEVVIQAINSGVDFYLQKGGDPRAQYAELAHNIRTAVTRRNSEKAFNESENRYRSLVENMHDCVAVYQAVDDGGDFVFLEFNKSAEKTEKISRNEVIGRRLTEVFPEVQEFGILDALRRVWRTNMPESFPVSFYRDNRISGWRDNFIFKLPSGEIVASYRDETDKKLAEVALARSEERYLSLFDRSLDVVYIHDLEGSFIDANPAALALLGYTRDDIPHLSFTSLIDGGQLNKAMETIRAIIEGGSHEGLVEYRVLRKNGEFVDIETKGSLILHDEKPYAILGIARDITERKMAETALRESKEFLNKILNSISDPVYVKGRDHRIILLNDAACRLFDLTREQIIGKSAYELFPGKEMADISWQKDEEVFTTGVESINEEINTYAHGKTLTVLVKKTRYKDTSGNQFLVGITTDITERKRADETLQRLTKFQESVITNARVWLSVLDSRGAILLWNTAAEEISGYPSGEVLGRKDIWKKIYPDNEYRKQITTTIDRIIRDKNYLENFETVILTKAGKEKVITWNTKGIHDATGKLADFIAIGVDITDRKRAEVALNEANKKLNLLSGITRHDINNQIMTLNGFLGILHKKVPDPAFEDYFTRIAKASGRISAMIQFTKEYEQIGVHAPIWQNCRKLVETAAKQATLGHITVNNDLPACAEVFADPLIVKVFYNLMDNAVRYGEKITTIRFSAEERDRYNILVCEDDGVGVPAEEKEKIFERGVGKNTGLGLALSREILSIAGITISETGEPGKGARFEMAVPNAAWRTFP